ncbi:MAG: ROK family protein [Bryobacterales bacterium]|nr:ROK family protein [Bryobacterales bacterium]
MASIADQWLRDIVRILYQRRTLTRSDIVGVTGLNAASVSLALRHLLRNGTILKVGELQSNGGRRREVFTLNGEAAYFVGVDLEGLRLRFALSNCVGDIRYRWEEDLEFGQPLDIGKVVEGIRRVMRELDPIQRERVIAVGVSYPGLLDEEGRLTAFNLGWRGFPIRDELAAATDLPVFLEPDKHSCVLAERWLGRAQNSKSGLFLIIERGIGLGMFLEGKPIGGWHAMAGELGHCKIDPDAPDVCGCGARGCLEAIASSPNIVRQYVERAGLSGRAAAEVRVSDVFQRARQGDAAAQAVVERAGNALGLALSHAVNLLNPEIIVMGGDVLGAEDVLLPVVEASLERNALPNLTQDLTITMSGLGLDIRLKGAASLAFRKSLEDSSLLKKMCSPLVMRYGPVAARATR